MNEAIVSGVVTEIYKQFSELTGKAWDELTGKIANACHRYDKNYKERHGQLKVFCVGMREPTPLDDVYVDVQFLDHRTGLKYGSPEDIEQAFRERGKIRSLSSPDERQDGTQVANNKQYLMLLGGPGVGKSTFLRKVGFEALKGKRGHFQHKCIPVFLELKRFTEDQINIEALITKEFEICGYPYPDQVTKAALESGKLLILFDGLDEVPTVNVDNVIRKIGDFVDQYSQNRFIASCRVAAYTGGFIRFTEVEMADFDDSQIEAYINNWFESASDWNRLQLDKEMKTAEQCWNALNTRGHHATKELARNPLLLTLLCMVYDNSQNFPRNRADLYEKALNIFIEEWAAEKRVRRNASVSQYLDIADEKRMLSEIAAKNFEKNRLLFKKNEIIDQIREFGEGSANTLSTFDAHKILETILIDQGLFVERVSDFYSFSHLTFQEYLTANYIVGDTQSIQRLTTQYLHNSQWREVFLLTAGRMREADRLLKGMATEAAKSINTARLRELFRWAKRLTNTTDDRYSGVAKRMAAIRYYFSLCILNKIYQEIRNTTNRNRDLEWYFRLYRDLYTDLSFDLDLNFGLYQDPNRDRDRAVELYRELYNNFDGDLKLYLKYYLSFDYAYHIAFGQDLKFVFYPHRDLNLHQDFYQYMDTDFYSSASSKFGDWLDRELEERVTLIERMEQMKLFKGVDLQRMVWRFNEQQKFIKAVREEKSFKTPEESIHDTWLSVLGITNDMLAISCEEMENYVQYFRAMQFILDCKKAAGHVSPEVWQEVEDQLLTLDTEDIPD